MVFMITFIIIVISALLFAAAFCLGYFMKDFKAAGKKPIEIRPGDDDDLSSFLKYDGSYKGEEGWKK